MRGKARKLPTPPRRVRVESVGLETTCRTPARKLAPRLSCVVDTAGGRSIFHSAKMTARNESAFTKKQAPVPEAELARITPARAGPSARDRLNCSAFRATALGMRSLGTRLGRTAW